MAVFVYRGIIIGSGKSVQAVRDADNVRALRAVLRKEGVMLTSAEEDTRGTSTGNKRGGLLAFWKNRISGQDVAMVTRQLATLVGAGIPLVKAVTVLAEKSSKLELQRVLTQIRDQLNEGTSLAKSMEAHTKVFPPLYFSMVAAGEASGTLEEVLERLADFMENQARLKGKVTGALAYPILMTMIGALIISLMMTAVVPKVKGIFESLDRALPWYTETLLVISSVLSSAAFGGTIIGMILTVFARRAFAAAAGPTEKKGAMNLAPKRKPMSGAAVGAIVVSIITVLLFFYVESPLWFGGGILGGIALGFALARFLAFLGTDKGRLWRDTRMLGMPIFGELFRMLAVARFARTLGTLLKAGVPILKAMDIVVAVIGNARLASIVQEAQVAVREGSSLGVPLKKSNAFDPTVVLMIEVGEESGELEKMLENVAKDYDSQVEIRVQALTSLLEPLIIVFMGGAVGFIAFSILMPLIQMNEFVQ